MCFPSSSLCTHLASSASDREAARMGSPSSASSPASFASCSSVTIRTLGRDTSRAVTSRRSKRSSLGTTVTPMKLAEALMERKDTKARMEALKKRLYQNAKTEEGVPPAEAPSGLLDELAREVS